MNKQSVMLDLETLGNSPRAAIVAIGAVKFDAAGIQSEFYTRVCARSCVAAGLRMDVDTVLWWFKQNEAARTELTLPAAHLSCALMDFTQWLRGPEVELWGNGSDFDNALLTAAYRAVDLALPWKFWNNRCYRTLKNICAVPMPKSEGTKHNALDDAKAQALHLNEIFRALAR